MSTTFTVPRTARPISEGMFADLGVARVSFQALDDGGQQVTVLDADLTADQVRRLKIRLTTADAEDEQTTVDAVASIDTDDAYTALTAPTPDQQTAQVAALTSQVRSLLAWLARDALS